MTKSSKYLLFIALMFGVLVNFSNPTMPLYLVHLDLDKSFIGWFLASASLGLLLMAPIWGAIGDIKDRNKVLAFVFLGFAVGQTLFGIFENPYLLIGAALISGFSIAGALVNIYSYINDNYDDESERNKMLSYTVSLYLVGGAFAYLIGGFVTEYISELRYVFFIQGGLVFLFFLYIYFEKTNLKDVDHSLSRSSFVKQLKHVSTLPWIPIYTISLTFFISFSHNNVRRYIDYYISDSGYNPIELGVFIFVVGIVSLIANLWIAPFFLKRYHNFRFLQFQFLFAIIFLYLTFQTDNLMIGL
ncbi:MAG: MFS transporter, partial [Candidatus Izemoplasma sp.]